MPDTDSAPVRGSQPGWSSLPALARRGWDTCAFVVALAAALAFLMWKARGNTFFYDEWTWITTRGSGLHAVVASYNNHMLLAPIALYQLLFHVVGLKQYWIYRLVGTCAHLACVSVVYAYARRRLGATALLLVLPLLVLGYGWEYVLWPVNVGFIASIAFGIAALLVLDGDWRRRDPLACLLLLLGLACSEFALTFALGAAVELLWRTGRRRRAYVWALPLLAYAVWWLAYHESSRATGNVLAAPAFGLDLAAAAAGGLLGLPLTWGRLLLAGGGVVTLRHLMQVRVARPRPWALLMVAAAFWLLVALGRAQLGDATAPRYIYTGSILLVLILAEVWRDASRNRTHFAVLAAAAALSLVGNLGALRVGEQHLRLASRVARAELGALQLLRSAPPPTLLIDRLYMPDVTVQLYDAAVYKFGLPATDAPAQIATEGGAPTAGADRLLIRGGSLQLNSPTELWSRRCAAAAELAGAAVTRPLPPTGVLLRAPRRGFLKVAARRFSNRFARTPLAILRDGAAVMVVPRPDGAKVPWVLRLSLTAPASICRR